MLRITIHNEAQETNFIVEGRLVGLWVKELEKCWESALAADPVRPMQVNLAAVTFVDSVGRELMTRMRRQGAELATDGCLLDAIVAEIEAELKQEEQAWTFRSKWRLTTN